MGFATSSDLDASTATATTTDTSSKVKDIDVCWGDDVWRWLLREWRRWLLCERRWRRTMVRGVGDGCRWSI
ncbi:hypothetical protein HanRHA438_Chr13g0584051 [Helianthus annuus]|nr:hypothetical protein HanHA300_Chr13g0469551 [Helianthus annuus]KAJ0662623.1 hypothetical protein HanLR1_Chr13g0471751 [Helianthus annuus]KAJ0670134.1 hypothetical protein HanOQP8_Chr13g0470691 [Helianthus annuus]KAJ0856919.1 hypothetical protein HanRHA438_Chr13g0584051 [Helianthus annuus]